MAQHIDLKPKKIRSAMDKRADHHPDPKEFVMSVKGRDAREHASEVVVWNDTNNHKTCMLWNFYPHREAYVIRSAVHPDMCMTAMITDGSYNGKVQMTPMCGHCKKFTDHQLWMVVATANGKQRIKLANSKPDVYMHSCNHNFLSNGQAIKIDSINEGPLISVDWKIEDA